MQQRYARIETEYLNARIAALPEDTPHPLGAVMVQDAAGGNTLQKIFRRQQAAQRDWYKAIETLSRIQDARRHAESHTVTPRSTTDSSSNRVRFDAPPQSPARTAPEPPVNLALRL
jgi:hypothetical protein